MDTDPQTSSRVAGPAAGAARLDAGNRRTGTILLAVTIVLLLLSVTAIMLNRQTAMRVIMAANVSRAAQVRCAESAVMEQAVWRLTSDTMWRTGQNPETISFAGATFELWVANATPAQYTDAVVIACRQTAAAGARRARAVRYAIGTVAGTGTPGDTGDGGPARAAQVRRPAAVVAGRADETILADTANHRIRVVDAAGTIRTIAGTGSAGYGGDGGAATAARLDAPCGMYVATDGDLYFADRNNHLIRMISAQSGRIFKVAGDIVDGQPVKGDEANQFDTPRDVHVVEFSSGSRDLYVADTDNHRIRKLSAGGVYSQVAGTTGPGGYNGDGIAATAAKLNHPAGVWVTNDGRVYIADTDNHRIRLVGRDGTIATVAGNGSSGNAGDGGPATSANLNGPRDVACDPAGNLFIADCENNRIRVVSVHDGNIYPVAGTGTAGFNGDAQPAVAAELNRPYGVALLQTRGARAILIADRDNHRVRRLTLDAVSALY
jgi:hypothetical protein